MSPLEEDNLQELCRKISAIHGIAYSWDVNSETIELGLNSVVKKVASIAVQDRTRQTIKAIVQFLDEQLEENE